MATAAYEKPTAKYIRIELETDQQLIRTIDDSKHFCELLLR